MSGKACEPHCALAKKPYLHHIVISTKYYQTNLVNHMLLANPDGSSWLKVVNGMQNIWDLVPSSKNINDDQEKKKRKPSLTSIISKQPLLAIITMINHKLNMNH